MTFEQYLIKMSYLTGAEVGDLFDDYFKPQEDPMDRDLRLKMIFNLRYPNY